MSRFNKLGAMTAALSVLLSLLSTRGANSQTSEVWLTTGNGASKLSQQSSLTFGANSGSSTTITVNEGTTYQSVDGYGFTLTEGSAEVIGAMASTQQNALLNELFGSGGIGLSAIRISIGASDLSSSTYSYRDGASFSLAGPDLTHLIPMIKKILAINPAIKILATPWSAPRWMKTNGSWIGGSLNTSNYGDYATYFLDYLNAMRGQGIEIWAITPQNEPENPFNEPSMLMTASQQLDFINNHLGPRIRNAGYQTKIIAFDHNCDNTSYPIQVLNGSSYVDGAAFHLYAGNISAMSTVRSQTGKNVYFTEQFTSSNGNFGGDLAWHMQNVVIGASNNWARTVFEWNLATNSSYGPRTPGGCTECLGALTITSSTAFTRNVSYYIMGHIARFVKPGAVRISSTSNNGSLINTAFRNSDGSKSLIVLNTGSSSTFRVVWNNQSFTYTLGTGNVVTFKWNGTAPPPPSCSGTFAAVPGTIQAESYCSMSGIQTENTTDTGGGQNVGWIEANDWMAYKINVPSTGTYTVSYRVASPSGGGNIRLERFGGGTTFGTIAVGSTGGWQTWTTLSHNVNLTAGQQDIALVAVAGGFNINWFSIASTTTPPPPPPGPPIGSLITLLGNNNMYVSGEDGTQAMRCNRATAGTWEQFAVVDAGGGKIGLRSMSKYVSSENGATSGITCNRTTIGGSGSWEHFDWVVNADGKISLRGNNGQYITSNNGVGAMTCNKTAISGWEAFTYTVVGTARVATTDGISNPLTPDEITNNAFGDVHLYPNPANGGSVKIKIDPKNATNAFITITDSKGEMVWSRQVKDPSAEFGIEKNLKPGLYHVQIITRGKKTIKRLVID